MARLAIHSISSSCELADFARLGLRAIAIRIDQKNVRVTFFERPPEAQGFDHCRLNDLCLREVPRQTITLSTRGEVILSRPGVGSFVVSLLSGPHIHIRELEAPSDRRVA